MAQQIASLYADIGAKTDGFEKGAASVKSGLSGLATNAAVVTAALTIMHESFNMAREGAELQRLRNSGEETARQFGGNMDLIIQKVKEASNGTVAEMDIIKSANKAMMLGLGADADQMANLMEVAAYRGRVMGLSTTQAFDDIVRGIGRASPMILDNLGIVVNANETYSTYAQKIGKTAGELTKAEKTQALLNAVLSEGNTMLAEAGGLADDNASKYERLTAMTKDLGDAMKETFSAGVIRFIYGQDEALNDLLETNKKMVVGNAEQAKKLKEIYEAEQAAAKATTERTSAVEDNTSAGIENIEMTDEMIEAISKLNASVIDDAIEITRSQQDYKEEQQGILDKIAETRAEGEKLYPWEHDKILENKDALEELGNQYFENQEKFKAAQEERAAMMAVEAIEMSDGIKGFSDLEMERARIILETADIATAAAFEEQQAMITLTQAIADGTLPVENWGGVFEQVMADGKVSVEEVQAAIDAVPKQNTITFDIVTNGAPPNLSLSNDPAPVGTRRRSNATGGLYSIPSGWGNEGMPIGNSDTASGGEGLKLIPKNGTGNEDIVEAIYGTRIDYNELAHALMMAAQQVSK